MKNENVIIRTMKELKDVKSQYEYLTDEINDIMDFTESEIYEYIKNGKIYNYYRDASILYEEYRKLILNNDCIRNENVMADLDNFTKHIVSVEEAMLYMLDISIDNELRF